MTGSCQLTKFNDYDDILSFQVTNAHTIDPFTTPLGTGTKSSLAKHHSSARNILAEKVKIS